MAGCGCNQGQAAASAAPLGNAGDELAQALAAGEAGATGDSFGALMGEAVFLSGEGLDEALGAELAMVQVEDEATAMQELREAMLDTGSAEPSLDDLLAIAKSRPGLKITLSY